MIRTFSTNMLLQIAILIATFALVYNKTIVNLVNAWFMDDNFSHGFLVPFIAGYMIWNKRDHYRGTTLSPNYLCFVLLILGMLLHIIGNIGAELFTMRFSIIVSLMGLTSLTFGVETLKKALVPICYLFFMIPIPAILWNKFAFPLQMFAAKLSAIFISFIGIAVYREGNVLHLYNTSLEVVDACSGLRSLTSMLALSAAFAYISTLKDIGKWILFLFAIPIAIAVNIVRLTFTAILARYIGPETAQGFMHNLSGYIIFIVAIILLCLTQALLKRINIFNIRKD